MTKEHLSDGRQAEEFEVFLWQHTNMCDIDLISEVAAVLAEAEYRKLINGKWLERKGVQGAGSELSCGSVYSYTYYICSMCNGYSERETNYCPHCGAHMKGGESDA